jgi:hypothetical protein
MRGLFLLCIAVLLCGALFPERTGAQTPENPENSGEVLPPKPEAPNPLSEEAILEQDITTSSLLELADWCRALGLSESGSKEELAGRLRSHYRIEAAVRVSAGTAGESKPPLSITIDSARITEYFTLEAVNEEYVRLKGGVSVSLKDGETVHILKAEEILYNRTRNLMSASGGVLYEKHDGDTTETFRGEGITVNLDTWATVFTEGYSEKALTEGANRYRFAGEIISRSADDSTVLKNADISNADNEEAYWSIGASRLWLLPGSDWAVFNAVLKVGEIPVLYLPVFYYPANEIVFHPILGYRTREGTFIQTTTYLMGRPKAQGTSEEMATISSIMGSGAGMEKKLEGVFLRSTGRKARNEKEVQLSIQLDAYANLGFYGGAELMLPAKGLFGDINFSGGVGISREIERSSTGFSPFSINNYDGTSEWHKSRFFSMTVPFRYRFITEGSLSGSGNVLSSASFLWNLPLYSDTYINNDFRHRSEDSDIFTILRQFSSPDITRRENSLGSYEWRLSGNLNFNVSTLTPYLNSLSISSISSSLTFNTKENRINPPRGDLSPYRYFFYPQKTTLFSVSATAGGIPMTVGSGMKTENSGNDGDEKEIFPGLGNPVFPWKTGETPPPPLRGGTDDVLSLPALSRKAETTVLGGQKLFIDYHLSPSAASELAFNSTDWMEQEDIDWSDVASQLYTVRADGNLGLTLSENRGLYTTSFRLYANSAWQDYMYINKNAPEFNTPVKEANRKREIHSINRVAASGEYSLTLNPFYGSGVWSATNFQYTLRGILVQTIYDQSGDSWTWKPGAWDKNNIEIHQARANINAQIMDKTQTLVLSAELPPKESAVTGDATLRMWISETNARSRIRKPFENDPFFEPVYLTETFRFADRVSLRQYAVYTPEVSGWTILTTNLSLWDLSASFTATRSKSYILDSGLLTSGWRESGTESLNPQELRINYNKSLKTDESKKIKFGIRIDTGLTFDLQRYTYSKFTFNLGLTASINRFLDITLNSYSENNEIYRYFKDYSSINSGLFIKNPLEDLLDSFRFDNPSLRQSSGFKLKSFGLDLVHHLGDWDATLAIKVAQELYEDPVSRIRKYRFNTTIGFLMQWKPVAELKTDIKYDKDGFRY